MASGEKVRKRNVPKAPSDGPVKFGPFWLDHRLAVGGTAEVYLAHPVDPEAQPRRLVVKRLLPHFLAEPEGRTMFEREAALHAAVRHENVVKVYGFGMVENEPWIAMEHIDGCDLFRMLRRVSSHGGGTRGLGVGVAIFVARELLSALQSVHSARDAKGQPMGIVHRDVTPSNVYLSTAGRVTLGDFGIARSATRATQRSGGVAMLKGKFAYLAPEQVAGEPSDHRADLFSLAAVVTEMLIGQPLFGGSGQLAVLLAIRDCCIDPLRTARHTLPKGLFEVLEHALAREPAARTPTATDLLNALAPFDSNPEAAKSELAALVRWVRAAPSLDQMQAVRDSAAELRAGAPVEGATPPESDLTTPHDADTERPTGEYGALPSYVVTNAGQRFGPWPFARLVEAIATGQVGPGDGVDYMGRGLQPLDGIEELERFLPAMTTGTTERVPGVCAPDFFDDVSCEALVTVLVRILETGATGVLFAEGPGESRPALSSGGEGGRKELYFVGGTLHHVSSNNASELLGEYLARRNVISREELDFALAVLPRYNGRMGDTLIALGLVGSLQVFRAIRDQGRERLVDLFRWRTGKLAFYAGQTAPHVDFPLELDLPALLIMGVEAAAPSNDAQVARWRDRLGDKIVPVPTPSVTLRDAPWPSSARCLLDNVLAPTTLADALSGIADVVPDSTAHERLVAFGVLLEAKLLAWA